MDYSIPGLQNEIEKAERDRLPPREITKLLKLLRAGDPAALLPLRNAFLHLVYERAVKQRITRDPRELIGPMFLGLATCIDRLRNNKISARALPKYINDELTRAGKDYYREVSPHLHPDASTNSRRRKKKQPVYETKRRSKIDVYELRRKVQRENNDVLLVDFADTLVQTPDEQNVFDLLLANTAKLAIAERLNMTPYQVNKVIGRFEERAVRDGYRLAV